MNLLDAVKCFEVLISLLGAQHSSSKDFCAGIIAALIRPNITCQDISIKGAYRKYLADGECGV